VRFAFIAEEKAAFPVRLLPHTAGVARGVLRLAGAPPGASGAGG
jgi:hypothetical protein